MTQVSTSPSIRTPVRSNIYTVLVAVAMVALAVAVGYVAYKNVQLTRDMTGQSHQPFYIAPQQ